MSSELFVWALQQREFTGAERLLFLYAADNNGNINLSGASEWTNLSEDEVIGVLYGLERAGHVEFGGGCVWPRLADLHNRAMRMPVSGRKASFRVSTEKRAEIYARDGHECVYCGAPRDLSLDHVLPQSRGGGDEDDNLVTCCRSCNSSKRDRTPSEWRGDL